MQPEARGEAHGEDRHPLTGVSQNEPVKSGGQAQVKLPTWSVHVPPFRHGTD